jgi:uncharacterized OsmC-like protein/pimeloyl-ACP methyl ester carboxylesterase
MIRERFLFTNRQGHQLSGTLERPMTQPKAFVLFAHCFTCSKNVKAASNIAQALTHRGLGVLRFDFTGLGNSEGDFANTNFSSNVDDLLRAAAAMSERSMAPELLVGHSLGGAAVLAAAAKIPSARAVATVSAPSDPAHVEHLFAENREIIDSNGEAEVTLAGRRFHIKKQFLDDIREQVLLQKISALRCALMVFHAPTDNLVSIEHARKIFDAAKHPKSFVSLDNADHMLSRPEDAHFVADVLAAWAGRYVGTKVESAEVHGVTVEETGTPYTNVIQASGHELVADEPEAVGGQNMGPSPYDLLLSALGACTSMTLRMYADRKNWPLRHVRVVLQHSRIHAKDCSTCESDQGMVDRIERTVFVEGDLDKEQQARLLEIANKCPVHRTLMGPKEIPTEFVLNGSSPERGL